MKYFLSIITIPLIVAACSMATKSNQPQGITGRVLWLEGNLMPSVGDTTMTDRLAGKPVQRTLYIHEATTPDETVKVQNSGIFYSEIQTRLVKKVKTDGSGTFRAELPPGKYSIFVQEKDGFFANIFDGEGHINPVTVEEDKFTEIEIKVNYMAFY